MKKTYLKQQLDKLYFMRDWSNFICDFFVELGHDSFEEWKVGVDENYKTGYIAAHEEALIDINETAKDLPRKHFNELNHRLKEKFGKTLFDMDKKREKKIASILKRNKVRNEDEFRMIQAYIEDIWQKPEKKNEYETLQELNYLFEQKIGS